MLFFACVFRSWTDREVTRLNTARTAREMMGTARSGSLTARSGLSVDRLAANDKCPDGNNVAALDAI